VNPGSKAAVESIREGEIITSINGQTTAGLPNTEAHALMKAGGDNLVLTLSQ
jgi:C-terminal processing protease CtpA/Prc